MSLSVIDLPQNREVEAAFLGCLLASEDRPEIDDLINEVSPNVFYDPKHQRIYETIKRLREKGQIANIITITDSLREDGYLEEAGGGSYISDLLTIGCIPSLARQYFEILRRDFQKRSLIESGLNLVDGAKAGREPGDLIKKISERMEGLLKNIPGKTGDIRVVGIADLLSLKFPPRENILDPWLPTQGLAMIHAPRGAGKTYLAFCVAVAVASGGNFLRWAAPKPRGVLYIDGELPGQVIQQRFAHIIGSIDTELMATLRIITPDLQPSGMPNLATVEGQEATEPHLEGVELVVIDSISTLCHGGRENDAESWLPMQEWALKLRARGLSIIFLHHDGKGGQQRGTSRKEDILDTVISLRHPGDYTPEEGLHCEVHFEKSRRIYGDAVKPFEVKLITAPGGRQTWKIKDIEESLTENVANLLNDGVPQNEISELLKVAKGTVSKHRKKAQSLGLIRA